KVWDARGGRPVWELPPDLGQGDAEVAFSPDGQWLVTAVAQACRFWRVGSWGPGPVLPREEAGSRFPPLAFTPDGQALAFPLSARQVPLLASPPLRELAPLVAPAPQRVFHLCFSPAGRQLAAACDRQRIQVWDLRELRRGLAGMGLDWDALPYPPAP